MSKASLIVGNGNWAIKDSSLLGYNINDSNIYSPFPFDVTRASAATRVDKDGLIVTDEEILSGELITNGDFATDSYWVKGTGWTISGGKANADTTGNFVNLYQNSIFVVGKTYKTTFTIADYTQGKVRLTEGGVDVSGYQNAVGTYTTYFTATQTALYMQGSESFIGSIDNVSVVEVNQKNLARIDYTDSDEGVLLTEPQSTNLMVRSNELVGLGGGVAELNSGISPDGTQNATKLTFGIGLNDGAMLYISGSPAVANTEHTFSIYAKSLVGDGQFNIRIDTDTQSVVANQNFTATTEWQRYSFQFTTDASSSTFSSNSRIRKIGNPNNEILFYGLQIEKLSYPTSLIPTSGSTVTRNQDLVANGGEVSTFNSEEGVLFVEIAALANDGTFRMISISDGSNNNRVRINYTPTNQQIQSRVVVGGVTQAEINKFGITNITDFTKIALSYKENEVKLYINGTLIGTDTSATMPSANTFDTLNFNGSINYSFYGKTKNIQVFKKALSDSELQILTTI